MKQSADRWSCSTPYGRRHRRSIAAVPAAGSSIVLAKARRVLGRRVVAAGMGAHFSLQIHDGRAREALVVIADNCSPPKPSPKTIYTTDLTGDNRMVVGNEGAA